MTSYFLVITLCSAGVLRLELKRTVEAMASHHLELALEFFQCSLPLHNPPSPKVKVLTYPRALRGAFRVSVVGEEGVRCGRGSGERGCWEPGGMLVWNAFGLLVSAGLNSY